MFAVILASERESPQEITRNRRPLRPPRLEAADGRGLRKPLPTGRGLGHPTPQRTALPTAADRALLSPRAPPSSRRGMQLPRKPARNLWAEGTCCAHQGFHRHSKHTHSTHRQHSHAGYQYPPLGTMGGLTLLKAEGGKPTTSERRRPDEGLLRGFTSDRSLGPRGSGGNARPRILSALSAGTLESFRMLSLNGSTKKHSNVSKELWQPQCQGHC